MNDSIEQNDPLRQLPTGKQPVEFCDDGKMRHTGIWNSYQFKPPLIHEDAVALYSQAESLGYRMLFRRADYSFEEVQARLENQGPSFFLDATIVTEDISPKEEPASAEQRMSARLANLAPVSELIVTDPYFFTSARARDADAYAATIGKIVGPALSADLHIIIIADESKIHAGVRRAVEAEFHSQAPGLTITVIHSDDFHDRFWIADRERGIVVGTSFNKIGRKLFFVDRLNQTDVEAVLIEVDALFER